MLNYLVDGEKNIDIYMISNYLFRGVFLFLVCLFFRLAYLFYYRVYREILWMIGHFQLSQFKRSFIMK